MICLIKIGHSKNKNVPSFFRHFAVQSALNERSACKVRMTIFHTLQHGLQLLLLLCPAQGALSDDAV